MKKITLTLFVIIFLFKISYSQENWDNIDLGNWGFIKMPNSMEVQSGNYKKILDYSKRYFSINAERIVFQQKGVNRGKNLDTYARVIIRTDFTYKTLPNLNVIELNYKEISALNSFYKKQAYIIANNPTFPFKIIKWNEVKIITLNGNKCVNYSYIREMKGKQTFSEFYIFWKEHRQHTLNIEYRISDSKIWEKVLKKCVNSFKLYD